MDMNAFFRKIAYFWKEPIFKPDNDLPTHRKYKKIIQILKRIQFGSSNYNSSNYFNFDNFITKYSDVQIKQNDMKEIINNIEEYFNSNI